MEGTKKMNRADLPPFSGYLQFPWLSLVKREVMIDLDYPLVLVSLCKF